MMNPLRIQTGLATNRHGPCRTKARPKTRLKPGEASAWASLAFLLAFSGCAFDVIHLKQVPAQFTPSTGEPSFTLEADVKAKLGTGYPTLLRSGTTWIPIGRIEFGDVYTTRDQLVTVEASNIHEADLVLSNRFLAGFRLKREGTFVPVSRPVPLQLSNPTQP